MSEHPRLNYGRENGACAGACRYITSITATPVIRHSEGLLSFFIPVITFHGQDVKSLSQSQWSSSFISPLYSLCKQTTPTKADKIFLPSSWLMLISVLRLFLPLCSDSTIRVALLRLARLSCCSHGLCVYSLLTQNVTCSLKSQLFFQPQ